MTVGDAPKEAGADPANEGWPVVINAPFAGLSSVTEGAVVSVAVMCRETAAVSHCGL
ncbi:MAG TPA: hypothetical protein VIM18_15640 [Solirubrobacteraceae bacterium]